MIGVDDRYTRAAAERIERAGKKVVRVSVEAPLRDGYYARRQPHPAQRRRQGASGGAARRHRFAARRAQCAERRLRGRGLRRARPRSRRNPERPGQLSRPRASHAAGRPEEDRRGQILFVNDSKATNADSAAKALASFNDIFWIAGGKPKTGGIESLAEFLPRIRKAYLIGEAAEEFAATLDGKVAYEIDGVLSAAIDAASRDAEASGLKEPVVLLSPACASFDQYPNFEVRGKAFTDLVLAMPGVEPL